MPTKSGYNKISKTSYGTKKLILVISFSAISIASVGYLFFQDQLLLTFMKTSKSKAIVIKSQRIHRGHGIFTNKYTYLFEAENNTYTGTYDEETLSSSMTETGDSIVIKYVVENPNISRYESLSE